MTMRITIKNEDTQRTARVQQRDFGRDDNGQDTGERAANYAPVDLAPGDTREFWICDGRDLVVEEVATKPAE